jgi:glucoamylase
MTEGVPVSFEQVSLHEWMARQYPLSAAAMLSAISATHLVKERRGFGQTIRPLPGSVLASTAPGAWDPDPDYFFHWLRDSAIVIDALRHIIAGGSHVKEGLSRFTEFVAFSLSLNGQDGGAFLSLHGDFRKNVDPSFLRYIRDDDELRAIRGDRILGEPRFNPDATLDISRWSRPQHDGPALRALILMRYWALDILNDEHRTAMRALIKTDLRFIAAHWREPCFDLWEEELGYHYYTRLLHHAALADGARWMQETGMDDAARQACLAAAQETAQTLDAYWRQDRGFYESRRNVVNPAPGKDLDFAVILAVIHAGRKAGTHSGLDPRVMATLARLEALFGASYMINRSRPENRGPAMGRYANDKYFSGGAYYFSTLGTAEFYYALAAAVAEGSDLPVTADNKEFTRMFGVADDDTRALPPGRNERPDFEALLRRGDQFMATVAAYTPASGELSEQFDQTTGAQTSAKTLAWSHAAFISAFASRQTALRAWNTRFEADLNQ